MRQKKWRKSMDNNNQNRNGGKRPSGQNIGVLALILVITLIAVTVMNNWSAKTRPRNSGMRNLWNT